MLADPHWQTRLFTGGDAPCPAGDAHLSPRAAYQQLLYGRAVLWDLRTAQQRERHGRIHPDLCPPAADRELPRRTDLPVIVLCQDGRAAPAAVETLRAAGREAIDVAGGYAAWAALGLPTA